MNGARTARCLAALGIVIGGCARREPPIARDEPVVVAPVDASTDSRPTFAGRRRLALKAAGDCVATDALYARVGSTVVRFTGAGAESSSTLETSFAAASSWDARGGTFAWVVDGASGVMLKVDTRSGAVRSFRVESEHTVQPTICGDWVMHARGTMIMTPTHGFRTDHLAFQALRGPARHEWPSGPFVAIHGLACAGGRSLAVFNDIVNPTLFEVAPSSGAKRTITRRAGEWSILRVAGGDDAVFVVPNAGVDGAIFGESVERIPLTGAPVAKQIFRVGPTDTVDAVFASNGVILVHVETRAAGAFTHALVEADARTGKLRRRIATEGAVRAAHLGDALVWCTDDAVWSLP